MDSAAFPTGAGQNEDLSPALRLRIPLLGQFEIARPQLLAGLLLLLLAAQAVIFAAQQPATEPAVSHIATISPERPLARVTDSILMFRLEQAAFVTAPGGMDWLLQHPRLLRIWLRLPALIFGLWLGGALWWVSRRLFNNHGGYVALALFCTSPQVLAAGSRVNAEILAAWGLFGAVYTAIGVAHTLYAPARQWRPRILLLGTALGLTAAAHIAAGLAAVAFALFFLLYLPFAKRRAAMAILAIAAAIAVAWLWALYGFGSGISRIDFRAISGLRISSGAASFFNPANIPLIALLLISVATLIAWRRARYFGNWAPLSVFVLLLAFAGRGADPQFWALPFVFVFIGGIFADLLEARLGELAAVTVLALVVAQEVFCLVMLAGG